jgi:hypothetical protein
MICHLANGFCIQLYSRQRSVCKWTAARIGLNEVDKLLMNLIPLSEVYKLYSDVGAMAIQN